MSARHSEGSLRSSLEDPRGAVWPPIQGPGELPREAGELAQNRRQEVPVLTRRRDARSLLLERDFQDTNSSEERTSQDDISFLEILEKGVHTNANGNLEMPLPFKARPRLPNKNHQMALARLRPLQTKFRRDPQYNTREASKR
jgi:hypothetical protein